MNLGPVSELVAQVELEKLRSCCYCSQAKLSPFPRSRIPMIGVVEPVEPVEFWAECSLLKMNRQEYRIPHYFE